MEEKGKTTTYSRRCYDDDVSTAVAHFPEVCYSRYSPWSPNTKQPTKNVSYGRKTKYTYLRLSSSPKRAPKFLLITLTLRYFLSWLP